MGNQNSSQTPEQSNLSLSIAIVVLLFLVVFSIGLAGFEYYFRLGLVDSVHNSAMYLTGMGPIAEANTTGEKLFASFYSVVAGFLFLAIAAYLVDEIVDILFFTNRQQ